MTQSIDLLTLILSLLLIYFLYKYIQNVIFVSKLFKYGPIGDGAYYWMHYKRGKSAFLLGDHLNIKEDSIFFFFISTLSKVLKVNFFVDSHLINPLIKLCGLVFLFFLSFVGNVSLSPFAFLLALVYLFAFPDNFLKVNLQSVQLYNFQPRYFSFLITSISYTLIVGISLLPYEIHASLFLKSLLLLFLILSAYVSKFSRQVLLFCLLPALAISDYKLFFISLLLLIILICSDTNLRLSCYYHFKHSKYLFSIRDHSYQASYSRFPLIRILKSIFESRFILFTTLYYIVFIPILFYGVLLHSQGSQIVAILLIPVVISFITGFKIFAFVGESFRYLTSTYFIAIPFLLLHLKHELSAIAVCIMLASSLCAYIFIKCLDSQYLKLQIDENISNQSLFYFYEEAVSSQVKAILASSSICCLPFRLGSILAAEGLLLKTSEFADNLGRVTSSYFELYPYMTITSKCFGLSKFFLARKSDLNPWLAQQNLSALPFSGVIRFELVSEDENFLLFRIFSSG